MSPALLTRDTDADWREIGRTEPLWGVLSHPRYRRAALEDAAEAEFYASGRTDVRFVVERLTALTGRAPSGSALDFGCGVGRLTEAMADHAEGVAGYDVSPGMLEVARARASSPDRVRYADVLPDGPFDWIMSYIVFQHVPPVRGYRLFETLLERLAPGGLLSVQLPYARDRAVYGSGVAAALRRAPVVSTLGAALRRRGSVAMYDYDLNRLCGLLRRRGVRRLQLEFTDHGGHHGAWIFAQAPEDGA